MSEAPARHHIIIVGGGAGGLELAVALGRRLGRRKLADVTLVDATLTHLWKPLLHEVAAGTLDSHEDDVDYLAVAYCNHFRFRLGRMDRLDRERREISLAPTLDEDGEEFIPRRTFRYDTLIMAVGSVTNDFGIPGVREHCLFLDSRRQADRFHQLLLKRCYQAHAQGSPLREGQLHVAIAGAGATGVELAAELHDATRQLVVFGLDRLNPERDVKLNIIDAADRVLPGLPPRISAATENILRKLGVGIHTGERIAQADAAGFHTAGGLFIPAEIKVWAAGIKAPDFLQGLDGLESNRANQLLVLPTLQTTLDESIFALGDCAACPIEPGSDQLVPPRAQAAHQQASLLVKSMRRRLQGKPLPEYRYKDYGSLINLSRYSAVGNLMGNLMGKPGSMMIEGMMARMAYLSLYKMHQRAVHGSVRVALNTLANLLTGRSKPRLKLH